MTDPQPAPPPVSVPRGRRPAAARAGAAFLLVAAVLATFVWLRIELGRDLDRLVALHVASLTPELLGPPFAPPASLVELGRLADRFAAAPEVARVAISKVMDVPRLGGARREQLLVPADEGRRPLEEATRGALRHAVDLGGDPAVADAFLYVWPDTTRRRVVTAWIAALGALLAGGALLAAGRARRREALLEQTTLELASRRAELRRAERLALAGQLAAGLLHDLKKPVNTIRALAGDQLGGVTLDGDLDDLDDPLADEDRLRQLAQWREVAEQTDLFHGLLRSTRLERFAQAGGAEAEWCDLADLVGRALDLVQCERGGVEVERADDPAAPLVHANPYELIQVLSNLVLNAYQALEGAGRVAIAVRAAPAPEGPPGGDRVVVTIDDSGPGIAADFLPRLFEPFTTTRLEAGGSGLGTYIAREIARSLGGSLEAAPQGPLGGARFTLTLPAGGPASPPPRRSPTE